MFLLTALRRKSHICLKEVHLGQSRVQREDRTSLAQSLLAHSRLDLRWHRDRDEGEGRPNGQRRRQ